MVGEGPRPAGAVRSRVFRRGTPPRPPEQRRGIDLARQRSGFKGRPPLEHGLPRSRFPAGKLPPHEKSTTPYPYVWGRQGTTTAAPYLHYSTWTTFTPPTAFGPSSSVLPSIRLGAIHSQSPERVMFLRGAAFQPSAKPVSDYYYNVTLKPDNTPGWIAGSTITDICGIPVPGSHVTGFAFGGASDPVFKLLLSYHQQLNRETRTAARELEAHVLADKRRVDAYEAALAEARQLARQAQDKLLLEGVNFKPQGLEPLPQSRVN